MLQIPELHLQLKTVMAQKEQTDAVFVVQVISLKTATINHTVHLQREQRFWRSKLYTGNRKGM